MTTTISDKRYTTNNSHLIESIMRHRILDSLFYKQYLFLTNEVTILPIIVNHIEYIGGMDSMGRPSPFICCLLRMLELDPSPEIVSACLDQKDFKYLTALMLIYIRLTCKSVQVYQQLEPYYQDYRKLRIQLTTPRTTEDGRQVRYALSYIDEWVDDLLLKERVIGLVVPRLTSREKLEDAGELERKREDDGCMDGDEDEDRDGDEDGDGETQGKSLDTHDNADNNFNTDGSDSYISDSD